MWKAYFSKANIYAIDIYDKSAIQEDRIRIFKGSQIDESFLSEVYQSIGSIDIVIDDGSHINEHVIKTFKTLFPLLSCNGIYAIEDIHTSYWPHAGGDSENLDNPSTSMNFCKRLTDCLNHKEFINSHELAYFDKHIVGVHFYHNLVVIKKGLNNEGSNTAGVCK